MARNIGPEDRVVRIVGAIAIALLIYFVPLEGVAAIIAGVAAVYLLVTGLLAICLFYKLVGMDTSVQEQPYSSTDDRAGL